MKTYDVIIIGGGQAGISVAYFLRRYKLDYLILDSQETPGGRWNQVWDSLHLFSPREYSSLSGWQFPKNKEVYAPKDEVIDYYTKYESRYELNVERPVEVDKVKFEDGIYKISSNKGDFMAKAVVVATGANNIPEIPNIKNKDQYKGIQMHSLDYRTPNDFVGKKTLILGGGNSGAQILAEVSEHTETVWATLQEPQFLPDDQDGRYLFTRSNEAYLNGKTDVSLKDDLGKIVMVAPVKEARERDVLHARKSDFEFTEDGVIWGNGEEEKFDAVIYSTGFKPDLSLLSSLDVIEDNKIATNETESIKQKGLYLVGLGNWTGYASATIYGVGKTARDTAQKIANYLDK
ncbi:ArsO family NAD(P)H-dependent flavin-containing monooxygenase [Flammeovirga agarivorans]|uniref:NAD(P)/FAD-dependent oxidoreductase n=1 Tax=Flammeovirga agarivorans TaxID=2726742 RepID=A0A7X8SQC4_9BACT|nr:ArsO family NAD(P)H-dependent flavin-containing monooxygenase [Flammeovirga agarivorans]NLR94282.1 NAD(P)/FAD-dependent oxidoreductase [Flammeovirga agarivorans]